MYQGSYGSTGIALIINGQRYAGFQVRYADGFSETWVINPGWSTSTVKLFDAPAPDSLKPGGSGCQGTG